MDLVFSKNITFLPDELITHILSYVDPKTLLKCRLVCKDWNEIIMSHSVWFMKYRREYHESPKQLPWYLYYCLFTNFFNVNQLKNVNGENKFKNWELLRNGGDGFIVEDNPVGSKPLPPNVEEFGNNKSCFATSYWTCTKKQVIPLTERAKVILNKFKPSIYVSEWVAARFDCGCEYQAKILVTSSTGKKTEQVMVHTVEQWTEAEWVKLEMIVTDYPDDVECIEFYHEGKDSKFWKGHYGIKMAGAVVKFIFKSLEPVTDNNSVIA